MPLGFKKGAKPNLCLSESSYLLLRTPLDLKSYLRRCLTHLKRDETNTVGINPRLSDLKGPGTSKLDWRYLEHNKIDRNELQIRTNSQKGTGTKIAEKLNNFEKFERKKVKFQPCS